MRAAVLRQPRSELSLEDVPEPKLGRGEVLVRVKACGLCHTDLHLIDGEWPLPKLPLIPGHEAVGIVEDIGPEVEAVKVGDRIGVSWIQSTCGICEYCLTGNENFCNQQTITGYTVDGGYAEYLKAPASFVTRVPDHLGDEEAAPFFCAGLATYKALKLSEARAGEVLAVFGVGGLGHMAIQIARSMGIRVVAVDVVAEKLELARSLGAELAVDACREDPVQVIGRMGGARAALNVAASPQAIDQAFRSLKRGGTLVAVGFPPGNLSVPIFDLIRRRIKIIGTGMGTRQDLREVLSLSALNNIRPHVERYQLVEINRAVERLRQGQVKGRAVLLTS